MAEETVRKIRAWLLLSRRFIWQRKGLWLRAALCWTVGMVFTLVDREYDYDQRLLIRGEQLTDQQLVIIKIRHDHFTDWQKSMDNSKLATRQLPSFITDSSFWDEKIWIQLLGKILNEHPLVVGVSPYFGENIAPPSTEALRSPVFTDSRIVWSTLMNAEGRTLSSWFGKKRTHTVGLNEPYVDNDGVVRRFNLDQDKLPHLAIQILKKIPNFRKADFLSAHESDPVINFRGQADSFKQISFLDFMRNSYPQNFLKNKIVIIGTSNVDGVVFRTPNGLMSRDEITATLIDNIKNERWIHRLNVIGLGLLLFVFVLFSAWITSHYPQTFAFSLIVCFNIFYAALSIWIFDAHYIWTPIYATALVSLVTYVTFLSFQLTLKEYLNLQLENEKQFLYEVEQLKNNFLSLISHDLKTPIAKIQAICDRLIAQHQNQEIASDLTSLRDVASELHRYIRTILEITRVESRNFSINKDSTDINEIIESVVEQLGPLASNKRITISLALEPMFLIEADQILIHEVVLNLIENAIKYTPEGGQVKVSSREVDDRVIVMVEDNGPGIPQEEQMRIFEKFYRGELGKAQPKGSGLGLYLVKYFVELHEGKVFIESQLNQGTKVGFSLPISEESQFAETSQAPQLNTQTPGLSPAEPALHEVKNEVRS